MLKVYWFGYGGSSWMAEKLRYLIEDELEMKLITIHEHPNADIQWNIDTVYNHLKEADIIIIPANFKKQPCKSNNRLTQAMALGKPIICDPLPAYKNIVRHGINAFITDNGEESEWRSYLTSLKYDHVRKKLSENALETSKKYTVEKASLKWLEALKNLKKEEKAIDVIIPTKNNIEILDECLKSFKNSNLNEEIYIVDNGDDNNVEELVKKYGVPYKVKEI